MAWDKDKYKPASLVFQLLTEGGSEELAKEADRTAIKYLKEGEEEWLNTRTQGYQGLSTGYPGVDEIIGSFVPGELWTIGGDTGHGKSLMAMNIAQNVYQKYLRPVLFVNLELTEKQSIERFYELSGDGHDYAGILTQTASEVGYKDIDIIMRKAKQEDACLVVIDHLHFFNDSLGDNQASALSRVMKHFKECARQLELPVILLSHVTLGKKLDRNSGEETTLKPDLHSFRGSKSIEQTSDMVSFVYRDQENHNQLELYMRKNRSRPLNKNPVMFEQTGWRLNQVWPPSNTLSPQPKENSPSPSGYLGENQLPV